jgi:hypothetical protein
MAKKAAERQDIFLFPTYPMRIFIDVLFGSQVIFSTPVSYSSQGNVASPTRPEVWPAFSYFLCFDSLTNFSILLSLLMIGFQISVFNRSLDSFFSTIWHLFSVLLSDHMIRISKLIHERILIGVWLLMAGNVLLSAFSGCLWGFMIRKTPIQRIDSWNDLYRNFGDMKILAPSFMALADFAQNDESDMAQNFKQRLEEFDPSDLLDPIIQEEIVEKILIGKHVAVLEYYMLHYYKSTMNRMKQIRSEFREGLDFHISQEGYGMSPYFISVMNNENALIINTLNRV